VGAPAMQAATAAAAALARRQRLGGTFDVSALEAAAGVR
jgi:hypothetical protein